MTAIIDIEDQGAIRVIALNRPARMNAFDSDQAIGLRDAMRTALADERVRALVMTGRGANFCTGADLKRDREAEARGGLDLVEILQEVFLLLRFGGKPSVAAVSGHAIGAGVSIALACDFIVADTTAQFTTAFTAVGLAPDLGLGVTLPERVGISAAREMLLMGARKNAAESLALHLIDEVCEAGQALTLALARAERLTARAPLAMAATRAMLAGSRPDVEAALQREVSVQKQLRVSDDAKEAAEAFAQKRPPVFKGR